MGIDKFRLGRECSDAGGEDDSLVGQVVVSAMKQWESDMDANLGWDGPPIFAVVIEHQGTVALIPVPTVTELAMELSERQWEAMLALLAVPRPPFDQVLAAVFAVEAWMLSGQEGDPVDEAERALALARGKVSDHPQRQEVRMLTAYCSDDVIRCVQRYRLMDLVETWREEQVELILDGQDVNSTLVRVGRYLMGADA